MTPALYMHSLQLENFRGFQELSLQLHPRLNVFLGNNGAGKSSILEALKISLKTITSKLGKNSSAKSSTLHDNVRNGAHESMINVTMFDFHDISWTVQIIPTIKNGKKAAICHRGSPDILHYIRDLERQILFSVDPQSLPIFVSYQANRNPSSDTQPKKSKMTELSLTNCYDNAIDGSPHFYTFFEWFEKKENIENAEKVKKENLKHIDPQLQVIRNAIEESLGFYSLTVDRKHEASTFTLKKNNQELSYNQLSDGEKGYLLLVADIARRLAIANPHNDNPLNGKGIIIIDEIELHLHPKWQRQIISQLMNTFSGCQFIITTHSPQVIGEVPAESIWILEEGEAPYHPERSYGMDSSELLREVMGAPTMNEDVLQKLRIIEKLIDTENYDQAREAISTLAQKTKAIPALMGMNALLTMEGEEQADIDN